MLAVYRTGVRVFIGIVAVIIVFLALTNGDGDH